MPIEPFLADHRAVLSLLLLGAMLVAFVRETLPPSAVAVVGASVFIVLGFVETDDVLAVFANPAAITVGAMLVLSAALVRTGTLEALAGRVLLLARTRPTSAVLALFAAAMLASAFVNSTPIVVILIPLATALGGAIGIGARKLLIPLSYVAILGGTCTLIGTSTNLLVDSIARAEGYRGFGIFDISAVGLCAAAAGALFLWASGRFLLPGRDGRETLGTPDEPTDIVTEARIGERFAELGKPYAKSPLLAPRGVRPLGIVRAGKRLGKEAETALVAPRDRLVLRVTSPELATLVGRNGLDVGVRVRRRSEVPERTARATVVGDSEAIGKRLVDAHFLSRHPVSVVGVRRRRNLAGPDLATLLVRAGDQLWLRGTEDALRGVAEDPALVVSSFPPTKPFLRQRALLAVATLALVILVAALELVPIVTAAIVGVGFLLAIGSLDTTDAWSALNADVLVLIYAMLVVGAGLQDTGAVDLVVTTLTPWLETLPPLGLILALYALTSLLTESITNNAVAAIMTPLVLALAARLGIDPTPLLVAVMFGASASFATPIGYQTNTLVHTAGNYRFAEFLRIGIPMNVVVGLATCLAIRYLMMD